MSGTIHQVSVMLGNCGDRMTAQGRGAPPCSNAEILRSWESRDRSRPWLFLVVGLWRADEAEAVNSHVDFPHPCLFFSSSLPIPFPLVELSPCCNLGLEFLCCKNM